MKTHMTERVHFWDNLKALLIFMVVIGHALYYPGISELAPVPIFFIYSIHMPLFIFCGGLFIKKVKANRVAAYLVLYMVFKVSRYLFIKYFLHREGAKLLFFVEGGVPWYLFAMAAWMCLIYLLRNFQPKYIMTLSIILGVLVGLDKTVSDFLVLSRVIVFFPFFYAGHLFNRQAIEKWIFSLQKKHIRWLSLSVLLINITVLCFTDNLLKKVGIFSGRNSFEALGYGVEGIWVRLFAYTYTCLIAVAVMLLVPKGKYFFTQLGSRTLAIYFLHYFVIDAYYKYGLLDMMKRHFPRKWFYLYLLQFTIITFILAIPLLSKPFDKLMSLNLDYFKKSVN